MAWNYTLYLLYGLAFFTLGVAILSRDIRFSELGIARIIHLLALFGIVHGFHEWLQLLEHLEPTLGTPSFALFRLLVVSISFLFLLYFGLFLIIITYYGDQALQTTPRKIKALLGASALSVILVALYYDFVNGTDMNTRVCVAFPGGLLSGIGLILYARTVGPFSRKRARNFVYAGSFMICYAVLSGLVTSETIVPILGLSIVFLRSLCALCIMFFTIRALSIFNLEQQELINEQLLRFSQSEKLTSIGILAAGIAHEINNPLTNVSLNLEMLRDLVADDKRIQDKISAIERNVQRASTIAQELLHFSRDKASAMEPVDLNQIVASACTLLNNQPRSSIIEQQLQKIPPVMGISWKLEEVLINLLLNSFDACKPQDKITIETFYDPNSGGQETVVVVITDTGHGIPEEEIFNVFDPFYTTKEVGKGTGLGLSVCYNIIQQHGGKITLKNCEFGGTVATLSFPRAAHEKIYDSNTKDPGH